MGKSKVYVQFPKTGLGNMLLVWARAFAFGKENNLEVFTGSWWGLRPGVWLRREKHKRLYWGYFREDSFYRKLRVRLSRLLYKQIFEPASFEGQSSNHLFVFNTCETEGDYFKKLKPHREAIRKELYQMLSPALQAELKTYPKPVIGAHIRRGDFKLGSTITPLSFFIDAISRLRQLTGKIMPVTIFTDATPGELSEILSLPLVEIAKPKADILDILLLSQSEICILSISSTFSFWGAFLCDGIVLKHPDEWHPDIRPFEFNSKTYEGKFDPMKVDEQLLKNLQKKHIHEFQDQ